MLHCAVVWLYTDGVCNSEILCSLTVTNRTVTAESSGTCERPTFDQYTVISLAVLLICIFYVRFVNVCKMQIVFNIINLLPVQGMLLL